MDILKTILKKSYGELHDNLELFIISNIAWFAFASPFLLIQAYAFKTDSFGVWWAIASVATFLLIPAATAGLFHMTHLVGLYHEADFKDFLAGTRKYFLKSIAVFAIDFVLIAVLVVNLVFYVRLLPILSGAMRYFVLVALGFVIWALLFALLAQMYLFAVMVIQDTSLVGIVKNAFLLSTHNVFVTLILFLISATLSLIWIISGLGVLCFLGITTSLIGTIAAQEMLKQEQQLEEE
ncbi:MAG: hypothetical protein ABH868_02525 [bacterium]